MKTKLLLNISFLCLITSFSFSQEKNPVGQIKMDKEYVTVFKTDEVNWKEAKKEVEKNIDIFFKQNIEQTENELKELNILPSDTTWFKKYDKIKDTLSKIAIDLTEAERMYVLQELKGSFTHNPKFNTNPDDVIKSEILNEINKIKFPAKYPKKCKIDSINIKIDDGVIKSIVVTTNEEKFYNNFPISISNYNNYKKQKRYFNESEYNDQKVIKRFLLWNDVRKKIISLNEILSYEPLEAYNLIPDADEIILNSDDSTKTLYTSSDLNTLFNAKIFSDAFGLIGNESNGLIQTEISTKIYVNTKYLHGRKAVFFNDMDLGLSLMKYDSNDDTILVDFNDTTLNFMKALQTSYTRLGMKLNLFTINSKSLYKFNIGYNGYLSNISNYNSTFLLNSLYSEFKVLLRRNKNFGIEIGLTEYMMCSARGKSDVKLNNHKVFYITKPEIQLFWNPKENDKNNFFIRYSTYLNFDDKKNNFMQFQLGYSMDIKQLIKEKDEKD